MWEPRFPRGCWRGPGRREILRAMSQENVAAVQTAANAFARDGLDAFAEFWTDDIDHRAVEGALDDRGPIHGKAEMRAYLQDWFDTFDDFRAEPVELIDAGEDQVVAVLRIMGRAKLSGVETDLTYAALYTLRNGKIARGREYWTRDEALEAAGLRE
jgi:ketosteroid isomerase-like protein